MTHPLPYKFSPLFSVKCDLLLFLGPPLVGALLAYLIWTLHGMQAGPVERELLEYRAYSFYSIFFLTPHVYGTYYKIATDRKNHAKNYNNALLFFIGLSTISIYLFDRFPFYFASFLVYIDIFHNVRQQFGWLALAQRKQTLLHRFEKTLDRAMLYNITLAPLLWWHCNRTKYGWMQSDDLLQIIPNWVTPIVLSFHWILNLLYISYYLIRFTDSKEFNLGKHLVLFSTWVAYYLGILYLPDGLKMFMITFNHTVPYLFLVFKFGHAEKTQPRAELIISFAKYYFPLFLAGAAIFSLQFLKTNSYPYVSTCVAVLPLIGSIAHYYFDAIVWRIRNPKTNLVSFFRFQT